MEDTQPASVPTSGTDPTAAIEAIERLAKIIRQGPLQAFPEEPIVTPFGPAVLRAEGLRHVVITTARSDGENAPRTQVPLMVNRVPIQCAYALEKKDNERWLPQGGTYSYVRRVDGKELSWNARDKVNAELNALGSAWAESHPLVLEDAERVRLAHEVRKIEGEAHATLHTLQKQLANLNAANKALAAWQARHPQQ